MTGHTDQNQVICRAHSVILRQARASDQESYLRWMTSGEWREYDAPWEFTGPQPAAHVLRANFQQRFVHSHEQPRRRLIIANMEEQALGWVNRYAEPRFPDVWKVGICICEDEYLSRGLGTEALRLWIDYLFNNSDIHRIGLFTYEFNIRMIKVSEKLGLKHEGTDREIIKWQGKWIDRLHYGILRREWEERTG